MRGIVFCSLLVGLCGCSAQGAIDADAQAILLKAIDAHGGKNKLSQVRTEITTTRGTLRIPDSGDLPFTAETYSQLPGQFKNVVRTAFQGQTLVLIQILDGDRTFASVNGIAKPIPAPVLDDMKEARFAENVLTLTPLLEDKAYKVAALKEQDIKGRAALGVVVQAAGHKDYRMYFDKTSGLLVKTARQALNEKEQEVLQETYWDDYKETAGIQRPRRFVMFQNGMVHSLGEITEVRYPDRLPADTFAIPK
jgi:hypothetical protein